MAGDHPREAFHSKPMFQVAHTDLCFAEWTKVFSDEQLTAALLDKLTHRAHILEFIGQPGSRVDQQCPKVPTACR